MPRQMIIAVKHFFDKISFFICHINIFVLDFFPILFYNT